MLVRCYTDLGAELFRSSYLTLSVHHYGCTEETSNGTARTRTGLSKVPVQPGPGGNTRSRREEAVYVLAEISNQVTAKFRSSSGRATTSVPYIGQPPVLYFPRLCPTSAGAWSELGRCPLKRTSSSGCLRCTGHLLILGRAPADMFSDVATMGLRWGSSVRARWNLAPKLKFHRAATDEVLSNKRHGCRASVRPSLVKIASLAHRKLIGRAMWLGHYLPHNVGI